MSRMSIVVVALIVLASVIAGCGGSDEAVVTETPFEAATPAQSTQPEKAGDVDADGWSTATTMTATDPPDDNGVLVSDAFTASGDVRIVLEMSDGGGADGVVGTIIPADAEVSVDAAVEGEPVTVAAAAPEQVISGLDGDFVLVVSVATGTAWSLEIQTRR